MYQMNAKEGLREKMAILGSRRPYTHDDSGYNTGVTVSALDATAHVMSLQVLGQWSSHMAVEGEIQSEVHQTGTAGGLILVTMLRKTDVALQDELVSPAEIVEAVRSTFALNISEAALVFNVSRPTIYQWTRLDEISQVRSRLDRDRMKMLYRISKSWAERGPLHGDWLAEALPGGQTVLDLLCAKQLDEAALMLAHDTLLAKQGGRRGAEHKKALASVEALKGAFAGLAAMQEARRKTKGSA